MRRTTLALWSALALGALPVAAFGQWSDNFESYPLGPLVGQGGWESWDNAPGAAGFVVSDAQSHSSPQSVAITGADDAVHQYSGYNSGVWKYTAWVYLPPDFNNTQYFILLNDYAPGGSQQWSVDLGFDGLNNIASTMEIPAGQAPLVKGGWAEIKVVANLTADEQWVWYNGILLGTTTWTQGGILNIDTVDLWGDNNSYVVHYDDLDLSSTVATGACCFLDGTCTEDNTQIACEGAGGTFAGPGSTCADANCPVPGICGWIMEGPGIFQGNTCDEENSCNIKDSRDAQFEVTLPYQADWTFSVCNSQWDTYLHVGTACCEWTWRNDDAPGCGTGSELTITDLPAGLYYVTLEGTSQSQCGPYTLEVTSPCAVPCPPGGLDEQEPCGQQLNEGCNMPGTPAFIPISGGDVYCGEIFYDGATAQDGDWYEIVLTEPTVLEFLVEAEFPTLMGLAVVTTPGSGDCTQYEGSIGPFATTTNCGQLAFINTVCLDPGTYWLIVTANWQLGQVITCGDMSAYVATLTTTPCGTVCPEDLNGDGVVNVLDLLQLLAAWGNAGGVEDINGDGIVDVLDLLLVLAAWGPC